MLSSQRLSAFSGFTRGAISSILFPSSVKNNLLLHERHFAARKGKRAAMLALKKERKLTQVAKPKEIPAYLLRKVTVTAEQQRKRCVDENWFESLPIDDVWRTALYRGKPYSLREAIEMHRETHQPSILNDTEAFVYVTVDIDLHTKKKDQFLDEFNGVVTYPREFEAGISNKVIAICKTAEDQMKATEAGAVYAGSATLVKKILTGEVGMEEFDYIVCHPDMYKEITNLRGILKRNYPSAYNGLLRLDVDKAVQSFTKGMKYKSARSVAELDFGWVDICFGRLNMSETFLEENLKFFLNTLLKHRPQGAKVPFVIRTLMWCEKSTERIKIPHWEYLPGYESPDQEMKEEKEEAI